jgi:hypothetical protein
MKFASLLKGVILVSIFCDDVCLQLLVGVMSMTVEGGSLLEELEDVDHKDNIVKMNELRIIIIYTSRYFIW